MIRLHLACAAFFLLNVNAMANNLDDYSVRLDALWDYAKPAESEQRFRSERAHHKGDSREALEATTQVARAQGLQRKFGDADRTLDTVAPALDRMPARLRVRYLLERGRAQNSAGQPAIAVPLFMQALVASDADQLPEAQFYRVDGLHMLAIAAPASERLAWNEKALAIAEASDNPRVQRWCASLHNNIGWDYHDAGNYTKALAHFEQALPAWEARGDASNIRTAKWAIARALRSLQRYDEALRIQQALVVETEQAHEPDGFVYEEMGELMLVRDDPRAARDWFAKAYALLKEDPNFVASEPARLARMRELAEATKGATR